MDAMEAAYCNPYRFELPTFLPPAAQVCGGIAGLLCGKLRRWRNTCAHSTYML